MTTIHRATPFFVASPRQTESPAAPGGGKQPPSFSRANVSVLPNRSPATATAVAPARDRAMQELAGLVRDIEARLGPDSLNFPVGAGNGVVSRCGPGVILCSGSDIYFEIVDGKIVGQAGLSDAQISAFLGAAKTALG